MSSPTGPKPHHSLSRDGMKEVVQRILSNRAYITSQPVTGPNEGDHAAYPLQQGLNRIIACQGTA